MTKPNKGWIRRYSFPQMYSTPIGDKKHGDWVRYSDHLAALAEERRRTILAIEKLRSDFQAQGHHAIDEELWRFDEAIRNLGKVEGE